MQLRAQTLNTSSNNGQKQTKLCKENEVSGSLGGNILPHFWKRSVYFSKTILNADL
jgi:hypothetical protein